MSDGSPTTGDDQRDALVVEIVALRKQLHAMSAGLMATVEFPPDLTMRQLQALKLIGHSPGLTVHELGGYFSVSAPTASGLVDRLAAKGLVERTPDESDGRVRRLGLTGEGGATLDRLDASFDRMMGESISQLADDELTALRNYVQLLVTAASRRDR